MILPPVPTGELTILPSVPTGEVIRRLPVTGGEVTIVESVFDGELATVVTGAGDEFMTVPSLPDAELTTLLTGATGELTMFLWAPTGEITVGPSMTAEALFTIGTVAGLRTGDLGLSPRSQNCFRRVSLTLFCEDTSMKLGAYLPAKNTISRSKWVP